MADIRETAILIDHDVEEVRVDTNNRGMAGRLTRMGFQEVTQSDSEPYRRFVGTMKQIGFRKVRIPSHNPRVVRGNPFKNRKRPEKGSMTKADENSGKNYA